MAKQKLFRYDAIQELPNTMERKNYKPGQFADFRGKWNSSIFENNGELILELACGAGDYAIALSKLYPEKNFVAMDIKGDRLFKGAKIALENDLKNIRFFRASIDHILNYFAPNEVNEIWITFPDPYLSVTKQKKRLTHPKFLRFYQEILKTNGKIHLKTDSPELYTFTVEAIEDFAEFNIFDKIDDIYSLTDVPVILDIQTYYEKIHLSKGKEIKYVQFGFSDKQ